MQKQAACVCAAAGGGSRGHDCNGRQAASVRAAGGSGFSMRATACSGGSVHATACSGGGVCAAAGRGGRQHNCNGRQWWLRPTGSTIAMGGGGGGTKDGRTAARLRWTMATVMGNCGLRRALGGAVAEGGSKGNSWGSRGRCKEVLSVVVAGWAAVDSYFLLTCWICTQALCKGWFLEVRQRYSIVFPNI
jgi:hypothetical protein